MKKPEKTSYHQNAANENVPVKLNKKISKFRLAVFIFFVALAIVGALKAQFARQADNMTESSLHSGEIRDVPIKGMITMLDLGADKCIPCKMMAPILKELEQEYKDKAAIVFIDVWKNPDQAKRFGIQAIPTQIFFDRDGKEIFRHSGFLDKKSIAAMLEKSGVITR